MFLVPSFSYLLFGVNFSMIFFCSFLFKRGKKRVNTYWMTAAQILAVINVIMALFYIFDPTLFGLMDYIFLGLDPLTYLYILTAIVYLLLIVDYYVY